MWNDDVRDGTFLAAVGADSAEKQELDPRILARAKVVVDSLEQCAGIGELHHAIATGLVTNADVHAELADLVAGRRPGRETAEEITVFDSTGTAIEDVAAAAIVYERAVAAGLGLAYHLAPAAEFRVRREDVRSPARSSALPSSADRFARGR